MKEHIIILLLLACAACLFADGGQKRSVAVYMAGEEPEGARGSHGILGAELAKSITGSGEYTAVDRTDAILDKIGKEHAYQRSGAVDDAQIRDLGRQFGVQYLCVASVKDVSGGKYLLEARLVDVVTAEVVRVASASAGGIMGGGLQYAAQRVARTLVPGAGMSTPRFYAEAGAGYYMSVGDDKISGANGYAGATGFVRADRFHRLGVSAGVSGLYGFGDIAVDGAEYDATQMSVSGFLSGIFRMGYETRYIDLSLSAMLTFYDKTKYTGVVFGVDGAEDEDVHGTVSSDAAFGYSAAIGGRYEHIGGGVSYMPLSETTGVYLCGYIPAGKIIDVIPMVTVNIGEMTSLNFSCAAQFRF